jgi:alkanesulfonate monooxygenase SsuD/methylene tetrahydromethanopterin reductase-like flavin-dependent oxidoreductase (luciferase family)
LAAEARIVSVAAGDRRGEREGLLAELGLVLPNLGQLQSPTALVTLAQTAEELGFASVWTSEHVVVPPELFDPYGDTLASLTTLS